MEEILECRECKAGFTQALESSVVWSCSEHGLKALSISDVVNQLMDAKQRVKELEERNLWILETVREELGALTGDVPRDNLRLRATLDRVEKRQKKEITSK